MRGGTAQNEYVNFPQRLLNAGFVVALAISVTCLLLSATYLFTFLRSTTASISDISSGKSALTEKIMVLSINAQLASFRLALLSCGMFIGMSLCFFGFSLFLIGIRTEMGVGARYENATVQIARMSPGVFVMLCAVILIGLCATRHTPFGYKDSVAAQDTQQEPTDLPARDLGDKKR